MNKQIRQLTIGRSSDRFRHAQRRRAMNKSLFSKTKNDDEVIDIIARIFTYMAIPSAGLIILIALWTIFFKS